MSGTKAGVCLQSLDEMQPQIRAMGRSNVYYRELVGAEERVYVCVRSVLRRRSGRFPMVEIVAVD